MILIKDPISPHLKTYPCSVVFTLYDEEEDEDLDDNLEEFDDTDVNIKPSSRFVSNMQENQTNRENTSYIGGEENVTESE